MSFLRATLLATAALSLLAPTLPLGPTGQAQAAGKPRRPPVAQAPVQAPVQGGTIAAIKIIGNERIEDGTILSYLLLQPGDGFAADRMDRSLRTLYATGLFADVAVGRDGNNLVVRVTENPLVNAIYFEGIHALKDEDLRKELQLRPRAVFTTRLAQTDQQKLLGAYAGKGRFAATVEPEIVRLPQNRVNVVFKVVEGDQAEISRITFTGNKAFSEGELRAALDSREQRWWRFLSSSDQFNPDRVNFDRELLRRFYLAHGYADFDVVSQASEMSPDRKSFYITFQISEGERYKIGKVEITSTVPKLDVSKYNDLIGFKTDDYYNGEKVQRTSDDIADGIRSDGQIFIDVQPKIAHDAVKHVVALQFQVVPTPHVYIERINITGNSRTQDRVIRREFHFAEGDAYDQTLSRRARVKISDLGYFGDVKITSQAGSADDKTLLQTDVTEKATGELSLGGGYSTSSGALVQSGLREHNLVGTGIDAGISATIAAREKQVDVSATDPYFLDRNLVAGFDVFYLSNNNQYVSSYSETRYGTALRLGYAFNDHVVQSWTYSLVDRNVTNVSSYASVFVRDQEGYSLLSQLGQTLQFDWRDSRVDPHTGYVIRVGTDFAGLGGDIGYVRGKVDGTYYVPLDRWTGNADWTMVFAGGVGDIYHLQSKERIIDRFFLGGDNLRGFLDQGAGPHSRAYTDPVNSQYYGSDSLGGNFIWTQSSELRFPLPVSKDFGLTGRAFIDMGGLTGLNVPPNAQSACHNPAKEKQPYTYSCYFDDSAPRLAVGMGVSWNSPFGLINIDIGIPVLKKNYDQTQIFRFGFGTRFQ